MLQHKKPGVVAVLTIVKVAILFRTNFSQNAAAGQIHFKADFPLQCIKVQFYVTPQEVSYIEIPY